MEDYFKFAIDADVDLKKSEKEGKRIIQGYASTPKEDRQGEGLVQKGLDISDFVSFGYLNYDHDSSHILGFPTQNTMVDDKGLWVEGEMLKGMPLAERMWELAIALKKSNAPRKLGFSVEGKVLERDGKRITKAKIYNCAITPNPVNTEATWEAVVKSFRPDSDVTIGKSLDAGYGTTPSTQQDGGALRQEDLESSLKNLAFHLDNYDYWQKVKHKLANGDTTATRNDMVVYLQLAKGLSRSQAFQIIDTK